MLDDRNVFRAECLSCPPGECIQFDRPPPKAFPRACMYCGCPPVKHRKVNQIQSSTTSVQSVGTSVDLAAESLIEAVSNGRQAFPSTSNGLKCLIKPEHPSLTASICAISSVQSLGTLDYTASQEAESAILPSLKALHSVSNQTNGCTTGYKTNSTEISPASQRTIAAEEYELPKFSARVESALKCATQLNGSLWHHMISECCNFYLQDQSVRSRVAYERIGIAMVTAYPSVSSTGRNPWSRFAKCLSVKMRNVRSSKNKGAVARRGFQQLTTIFL